MLRRIAGAALALLMATTMQAQAADSAARPDTLPVRRTVVTINPFAVFALYFAGDVEQVVAPATTLGIGLSHAQTSDFYGYTSFEVKMRHYPAERALRGFSVAATMGFASARDGSYYEPSIYGPTGAGSERKTRGSIGTELSYQWLIGPKQRFVTVIGVGVKRLLGNDAQDGLLSTTVLPTARLNIGIAF